MRKELTKSRELSELLMPTLALALGLVANGGEAESLRIIASHLYHLGTPGQPEWEDFSGKIPHARRLDIRFNGQTNQHESTLFIRQDDVKLDWGTTDSRSHTSYSIVSVIY